MKLKLLIFGLGLLIQATNAQSVQRVFEDFRTKSGTQNQVCRSVTKLDNSGYTYVAGGSLNANGKMDLICSKFDREGKRQWVYIYNGLANDFDVATDMEVSHGSVYITGTVSNNTLTLTTDLIVLKVDASTGTLDWEQSFNGGTYDSGSDIEITSAGNIVVTGGSMSSNGDGDFVTMLLTIMEQFFGQQCVTKVIP